MDFISIDDAIKQAKGKIKIRGWCYRERGSKNVKFIVLRDHSNIIQCVVGNDNPSWDEAQKVYIETSLEIEGEIKEDKRAPTGFEVHVENLKVIGECEKYPITKDQSPEFLADNRHLWIRSRRMNAILKIRSTVIWAIHDFFRSKGYYEFSPPIFTPNACEGGSTLFEVKYFTDKIYLTQSWQLYAEAAVFSLGKIYDVSPTFRAEKSKTSRHLTEFWMSEMEAAWMGLDECAQVGKDEVRYIVQQVLKNNRRELEILERDIKKLELVAEKEYPTITYTEALKILKEKEGMDVNWGKDLRTIEEDKLMNHFDTPVVITNYPKETMAFYKPKDPKDETTALCFDMIAPEGYGEIIGGSQRDTDIKELESALKKEGEDPKNYSWYLDLRRYGSVPHSGYGLGTERVIAWVCGLDNIKDAIPFPRTMRRYKP